MKSSLVAVYKRYGFTLARDRDCVLVFTLKTGYFDNAEIVKLTATAETEKIFSEFSAAGYGCVIREAKTPEHAERELFQGFFSVESTRHRLIDDYKRFTEAVVSPYGTNASYQYIRAPYQVNGKEGRISPPDEIIQRMNDPEPTLFLIEAAAGFGKTCTAMEIVRLLAENQNHLPLYAELSRNRQARIFRYILLDEIDRTFPLLNSGLVQTEIRNGRVATILDGFDELLRKNEETGDFEQKEPMLETVSELLTGRAKVIITTRRTVFFDGDEFHQWLDRHAGNFKVVRIRIQEPRVADWLGEDRLEKISSTGLSLEAIANPVLLSYLRCIDQTAFNEVSKEPDRLVDSYFEYMLDREQERQDLRMLPSVQSEVLTAIAADMVEGGFTSATREYILELLLGKQGRVLEAARSHYPAADRPSREEIANKLASHALLDRSASEGSKISFINEFVLGNYVAGNILATDDWLNDDMRFIDPAVRCYASRTEEARHLLYEKLAESLPFLDSASKIDVATALTHSIPFKLAQSEAEGVQVDDVEVGAFEMEDFLFNDCTFRRCHFIRSNLSNVTFLNCKFYECTLAPGASGGAIFVLGGVADPDITKDMQSVADGKPRIDGEVNAFASAEIAILKKLWPIGESFNQRPSRVVVRPLKHLCLPTDNFSSSELYSAVDRLRRAGVLPDPSKSGLLLINLDKLAIVQDIVRNGA